LSCHFIRRKHPKQLKPEYELLLAIALRIHLEVLDLLQPFQTEDGEVAAMRIGSHWLLPALMKSAGWNPPGGGSADGIAE
jgi:hypothetical protein